MEITNVKYKSTKTDTVSAIVDGLFLDSIPCIEGNRHWDAIVTEGITPDPYVVPTSSVQSQIDEIEVQQTPRLMREAIAGELYATNKLTELDAQIAVLRTQL